jgi:hypothetical protein
LASSGRASAAAAGALVSSVALIERASLSAAIEVAIGAFIWGRVAKWEKVG